MKNIALLLLLFTSTFTFSQFGNNWIDFTAPHYTFGVTQDGVYRISYETIANTFPVSAVDYNDLKIYGKQKQIPIHINIGQDNVFNTGDFIEFYAERNDGWLDSLLYDAPNEIGNPDYSLYNDTLLYFLTYNNAPGLRYEVEQDFNFTGYTASNFILQELKQSFDNAYHVGFSIASSYSSYFENGEGWGSNAQNGGGNSNGYTFIFLQILRVFI